MPVTKFLIALMKKEKKSPKSVNISKRDNPVLYCHQCTFKGNKIRGVAKSNDFSLKFETSFIQFTYHSKLSPFTRIQLY